METVKLWQNTPGLAEETPVIEVYLPENKKSDAAVVIYPGGGYAKRAPHEGKGYAEFLNAHGITAFVVQYRVSPHTFPLPLVDARRGVRWVRQNAEKYGIDKNKIAVMGSSAGGHLAALTSTYLEPIEFEDVEPIDECFLPNMQILCYPVIVAPAPDKVAHFGSYRNLLGGESFTDAFKYDPSLLVSESTPRAFIWHTAADAGVNVINSYTYATKLRQNGVPVEMHIFPDGPHGLGLAEKYPHTAQWSSLLINSFKDLNWI